MKLQELFESFKFPEINFLHNKLKTKLSFDKIEIKAFDSVFFGVFLKDYLPPDFNQKKIKLSNFKLFRKKHLLKKDWLTYRDILLFDVDTDSFFKDTLELPFYDKREIAEYIFIKILESNDYSLRYIYKFMANYCRYNCINM